ncbi:MAG: hypothetical protein H7A32_04280 [Deltaproteobacteria bacterium]|nr:hypothetical protein [Deltaproteobacteria bacterium]
MSENRVNNQANEQLQAEIRAAQNRKVKTQVLQKSTQAQAHAQSKNQTRQKEEKSSFDRLLENMGQDASPAITGQSGFESRLAEVQPREEQSNRQESKEEKREEHSSSEKNESTQNQGRTTHRRIASKKSLKEQGEGQGEGKGDSGLGVKNIKKSPVNADNKTKKLAFDKKIQAAAPGPMMTSQAQSIEGLEAMQAPKELPPAVLAQIIQAATISRDKELNTEMRIELQDNFFNGTTLKVSRDKNGNISVTFLVPNRQVESTFKGEREKIAEALGNKDLDVRDIRVELS